MKIFYFKVRKKEILNFIRLCESYDIAILASWLIDGDIFAGDEIEGYIRIYKSTIPETMQLEKLNEKFGNNIKAV
jgi:hypothetical protein